MMVKSFFDKYQGEKLISRMLAINAQEVCSVHVGVQLTLQCKQNQSPHLPLFPCNVTLRLDSARLGVFRVL